MALIKYSKLLAELALVFRFGFRHSQRKCLSYETLLRNLRAAAETNRRADMFQRVLNRRIIADMLIRSKRALVALSYVRGY